MNQEEKVSGQYHVEISERSSFFRGLAINIWRFNKETGEAWLAKPIILEFEKVHPLEARGANTLEVSGLYSTGFLQAWVEALRLAGVKPEGFSNQIDAMQAHLEDMRALVFKSGKPGTTP